MKKRQKPFRCRITQNNVTRSVIHRAILLLVCWVLSALYRKYRFPLANNPNIALPHDHQQQLQCIGWRHSSRLLDLSCSTPIPKGATGHCELLAENGTVITAIHKSSRHHKKTAYLTCDMAVDFMMYKYQAGHFQQTPPMSLADSAGQRRGIVMSIYDEALVSSYAIIKLLRSYNCTLPVELWSKPGEIKNNDLLLEILKDSTTTHRIIEDGSVFGFMTKPYSVFYSTFDEILLLDADTVPARDPTYLFETKEFKDKGALFFKDYWQPSNTVFHMTSESLIWELLGIPFEDEFEMESGQVLIDKTRSKAALDMLMFLSSTYDQWIGPLKLAYGDKDLFRFAWKMTQSPYHYIKSPPSTAGFTTGDIDVCGVTLLQLDPSGGFVFLHRNTVKIKGYGSLKQVWYKGLTFIGTDPQQQYIIQPSPVKGQKIKCYHPTPETSKWFQEHNFSGTPIEATEKTFLSFAREAFLIVSASGLNGQ